ncbi:cytochrome b/b6 domain-containing protein [Streptomyces sp. NPDC006512]|uniref:cytochrome b n=1 Tax=Streptomyces sp. NPDC006512 TaxID=3154307 RepID=UPI0033BF430E
MTTPGTTGPRLRNGAYGYGLVTKALHWSVAGLLVVQFTLGYRMADDGGHGRGRGRDGDSGRGRGRGGEDGFVLFGEDRLLTAHALIGTAILVLAVVRLVWRRTTPLPPWSPALSPAERRLAHWTEASLYALLFAMPLTGMWLFAAGDDDALAPHVAAHLAFFAVLAVHLALVLGHTLVRRDHLLRRML